MDCFHQPNANAMYHAQEWQRINDEQAIGTAGKVANVDRRVLWGSYGTLNLHKVWHTYH
jgi:hypothetical protein